MQELVWPKEHNTAVSIGYRLVLVIAESENKRISQIVTSVNRDVGPCGQLGSSPL